MVELCQVSEHARQPGVVGATPHQPHGEDGVTSNGGVAIVGELAEGVQDGQLGVGGGEEGQGQGHCATNDRVSIVQLRNKSTVDNH